MRLRSTLTLIAVCLLAGALAAPAESVTPKEIEQARRQRGVLQKRLDAAVGEYERAESALAQTTLAISRAEVRLEEAERMLVSARTSIGQRANASYRAGRLVLWEVLLESRGLSDFVRRLAMIERASGADSVILLRAGRARSEVTEIKADLTTRRETQKELLARLSRLTNDLGAQFAVAKGLEVKLLADRAEEERRRKEAERRAALAAAAARRASRSAFNPGSFVCPVDGPNSFRDSWGEPRSGGRRHQGVDIYAGHGTPVAAVVDGVILRMQRSSLGGIALYLRGGDGSEYYYAHLAGYARSASAGATVGAGAHIAFVGNSGNAAGGPAHLHFEVHPGGGSAINPYPAVKAACG